MGKHCAAIGCSNTSKKLKTKCLKDGVTFHSFPLKNPKILKEWIHAIKRKNFDPTPYNFVCSEHFEESDFAYQPFTGMRMIKKGAVPSKFSFTKNCPERKRTSYTFGASVPDPEEPKDDASGKVSTGVQTDMTMDQIAELIKTSSVRTDLLEKLQATLSMRPFTVNVMTDGQLKDLTGFDKMCFKGIFNFFKLEECLEHRTKKCILSKANQLFLTLLKLRHNLTNRILAILFKLTLCSVNLVFNRCILIMFTKAKEVNIWPSVDQVKAYMPPIFFQSFPSCRVIIDATEFYIQKPGNPTAQQASFRTYKNYNTVKALIGITPSGAISFISDLWFGSISDKELTLRSRLIDKLDRGDMVLADRGFTSLETEFAKKDITLITPTFLKDKVQFPVSERSSNRNISSHRVHVERAIASITCFRILDGVISLALINIDQIYFVCAFLCNFTNTPLVSSKTMVKV